MASLCVHVEGVPLAIELAAAATRHAPLERVAEGLLHFAVDFADLPSRNRSLRGTIAYTWDLLDEEARDCLASISVFRGAFSPSAAAAVAGVDLLAALIDWELISPAGPDRYRMHALVRAFAREQLESRGKLDTALDAHRAWHLDRLVASATGLTGPSQRDVGDALMVGFEDLEAAWEHAVRTAHLRSIRDGFRPLFRLLRDRAETRAGAALFAQAVEVCRPEPQLRVALCQRLAEFLIAEERYAEADAVLDGLGVPEDPLECAFRLGIGYTHRSNTGACEPVLADLCRAADLYQSAGDLVGEAEARSRAARVHGYLEQSEPARVQVQRALALTKRTGDLRCRALCMQILGWIEVRSDAPDAARACFDASVEALRRLNAPITLANGIAGQAEAARLQYQWADARALFAEASQLYADLGSGFMQCYAKVNLARANWFLGDLETAESQCADAIRRAEELDRAEYVVAQGWCTRGLVAAARGERRQGAAALRRALDVLPPGDPSSETYFLFRLSLLTEDPRTCERLAERSAAVTVAPGAKYALLTELIAARASGLGGGLDAAIASIQSCGRSAESRPMAEFAAIALVDLLCQCGRFVDAAQSLSWLEQHHPLAVGEDLVLRARLPSAGSGPVGEGAALVGEVFA